MNLTTRDLTVGMMMDEYDDVKKLCQEIEKQIDSLDDNCTSKLCHVLMDAQEKLESYRVLIRSLKLDDRYVV